jgi:hypothetical protein
MSTLSAPTDVQILNLAFLQAIQSAIHRDPAQACYRFGLKPGDVEFFGSLRFDALQALALTLDQSVVGLRFSPEDLAEFAASPPSIAGLLAMVRAPAQGLRTQAQPS